MTTGIHSEQRQLKCNRMQHAHCLAVLTVRCAAAGAERLSVARGPKLRFGRVGSGNMNDPLATYLHDHLAGSSFAVELLENLVAEYAGTSSGEVARELLEQVLIDRKPLEQLIARVGEANPDLYDALGWIGERVSRIKLKHDDPAGIGALQAFETISLGILGKRALWDALRVRKNADSRLAGPDYDALIGRAEQRFQRANQHRLERTVSAFSGKESKTSRS